MTDNDLKKLKRKDLLEILYYMRKELDETRLENERLQELIDERNKNHEEVMEKLNKASKQIDRLCRVQLGDSKKSDDSNPKQEAKPQNKRKKKRRAENSGK